MQTKPNLEKATANAFSILNGLLDTNGELGAAAKRAGKLCLAHLELEHSALKALESACLARGVTNNGSEIQDALRALDHLRKERVS